MYIYHNNRCTFFIDTKRRSVRKTTSFYKPNALNFTFPVPLFARRILRFRCRVRQPNYSAETFTVIFVDTSGRNLISTVYTPGVFIGSFKIIFFLSTS